MGARRLLALVENLPPDAAMRDRVEWTTDQELAALLVERVHEAVRYLAVMVRVWADSKSRNRITVPEVLRIPRPTDPRPELENVDREDEWPPRMRVRSGRELMGRMLATVNEGG